MDIVREDVDKLAFPEIVYKQTHLGKEGHSFRDSVVYNTPDGFKIRVSQASYGGTWLRAAAEPNHKLSVLKKEDQGEVTWSDEINTGDFTLINGDWGNLQQIPLDVSLGNIQDRLGNEGIKWGVIKITAPDEKERFFALGAEFKGQADNWNVKTAYVEVFPEKNIVKPELPSEL